MAKAALKAFTKTTPVVGITATSPTRFTVRKSSDVLDAYNPRLRWALLVFSPNAVVEGGGA